MKRRLLNARHNLIAHPVAGLLWLSLRNIFWTAPTDLPEFDDGGLFERTIGALSRRAA